MNADEGELTRKRKQTARIVCLVAGLMVIGSLWSQWLRAAKPLDVGMSLLSFKACGEERDWDTGKKTHRCESMSNLELADQLKKRDEKAGTSFAYFGIATLVVSMIGGLALVAAGGLAFKDRFIREPVALTSVVLITLSLALVLGCIFVAVKPGDQGTARLLGVSWPFGLFGVGVVAGLAGAQLLAKSFAPPSDPYWDGIAPEPPNS